METSLTPDLIIQAYKQGIFPMAESRSGFRLDWYRPEQRGILPLRSFHLPRRLYRTLLSKPYTIKFDNNFLEIIDACAAPAPGREDSWINPVIRSLYQSLFAQKYVHTVEIWEDKELIGGLYGVAIGQAFFGESMFSRRRDTSKIALVYLVACLRLGGFQLLDTQFMTTHLAQFGGIVIPAQTYEQLLQKTLYKSAVWPAKVYDHRMILQEIRSMRA